MGQALAFRDLSQGASWVDPRLHAFDELLGAQVDLTLERLPWTGGADAFGDETPVASHRCGPLFGKHPQHRVGLQPPGRRHLSHHRAVAAPGPIARRRHHPCANRIQHHVPRQLQQVAVALYQNRLGSPLKLAGRPSPHGKR
jgi:hypothetical protein